MTKKKSIGQIQPKDFLIINHQNLFRYRWELFDEPVYLG
jgi:hypothetical protein